MKKLGSLNDCMEQGLLSKQPAKPTPLQPTLDYDLNIN